MADAIVWQDDSSPVSGWGGRAVVRLPATLVNDIGTTCTILWPTPGDGFMAGSFVLGAGQEGKLAETYRMHGTGALAVVPTDS
jgi:hypothetical protein